MVSKWVITYNLLVNGIYWVSNPFTNHLLTSWDIQVYVGGPCWLANTSWCIHFEEACRPQKLVV